MVKARIFKKRMPSKKGLKRKSLKPSKTLRKIIQKEIHKDAEDKIGNLSVDNTPYNSGIDSSGDISVLVPSIVQGVDSADRIGLEVRGKRHIVKGHIILNTSFSSMAILSNCRICVRLLVISVKQYPNCLQAKANATLWLPSLLENGNTVSSLDGTIRSMYLPINRKVVTVHSDKLMFVNTDFAVQNTAVGGYSTGVGQSVKFFNISIPCKKTLKYNDLQSVSTPTNYGPVICLGYCHLDGGAPDVLTTAVNMSYTTNFYYEDT